MARKKSLLIGINYRGTKDELKGCMNDVHHVKNFLRHHGFPDDPSHMVILSEDSHNPAMIPTGKNMLAAMHWLVSENRPGDSIFLHYSGHGSQVKDPDGDRDSGFDDTIVPLDYKTHGQLDSDLLHRTLVTALPRGVRMTVIFDCCHSGTAIELPYVYRSDADGKVNLVDTAKQGARLASAAYRMLQGGFNATKINEAKQLMAGASSFLKSLHHKGPQEEGLGEENFVEDWAGEERDVTMWSGCKDDQTSADTVQDGTAVGAMSWAFIKTMEANPRQSYVQVLQSTRGLLLGQYQQIPQFSCGRTNFNLDQPVVF